MIISLMVAFVLAALAVFGARDWLADQRAMLTTQAAAEVEQKDKAPENTLVVANEVISFGERLAPNKLREIEWSSPIRPDGSFNKISDLIIDDTDDNARFALANMTVGEPILATRITLPGVRAKLSTQLTPGMKAISIRVNDVLGVAGFVLPGDRVDVLLTRGGGSGTYVDVLLQGVKVLAIDQIADDRKDQPSVVRTVTFEVNTQEAQKLVLGANVGTLSLALRNVASTDVAPMDRITLNDLSDPAVADDLRPKAPAPEQAAPATNPDTERLDKLETLLQDLSNGINTRLSGFEEKIQEPEPRVVEKVVQIEKLVPQPKPDKATIGVIRNGRRAEYKVQVDENGEIISTGGEPVNIEGASAVPQSGATATAESQ